MFGCSVFQLNADGSHYGIRLETDYLGKRYESYYLLVENQTLRSHTLPPWISALKNLPKCHAKAGSWIQTLSMQVNAFVARRVQCEKLQELETKHAIGLLRCTVSLPMDDFELEWLHQGRQYRIRLSYSDPNESLPTEVHCTPEHPALIQRLQTIPLHLALLPLSSE